jgi:glutamate--cysteine ligase
MTSATLSTLLREAALAQLRRLDTAPSEGPARLGLEQEWHAFSRREPDRRLTPEELLAAALDPGPLPAGSTVSVEPGGQVELATAALDPWWRAVEALRTDGAVLRRRLADAGIAVLACGVDPFRPPVRTLRQPRYDAMEAYFDHWGPAGRRMMAASASIQLNIDIGPAETADQRWVVAHRIGPALAAAFANSPARGYRSQRLATWGELDPTRTRPALRRGTLDEDWADYVLGARVMLLHEDADHCAPVRRPLTFGDWVDEGLEGRRPGPDDLTYHCTTLFPPVRARGWLELRWLDSLPAGVAEPVAAAVTTLVVDPQAADEALEVSEPVALAWEDAATDGAANAALAHAAGRLLTLACQSLGRQGAPSWMITAVDGVAQQWPARFRSPADDLEDQLRAGVELPRLVDPPEEVVRWS